MLDEVLLLEFGFNALCQNLKTHAVTQLNKGISDDGIVLTFTDVFPKRTINFDPIHRESLQITKAGIAGTKIINSNTDAHLLETLEYLNHLFGVIHHHTLGQLDAEIAGSELKYSQKTPVTLRPGYSMIDSVIEQVTVGEACKTIVGCYMD